MLNFTQGCVKWWGSVEWWGGGVCNGGGVCSISFWPTKNIFALAIKGNEDNCMIQLMVFVTKGMCCEKMSTFSHPIASYPIAKFNCYFNLFPPRLAKTCPFVISFCL